MFYYVGCTIINLFFVKRIEIDDVDGFNTISFYDENDELIASRSYGQDEEIDMAQEELDQIQEAMQKKGIIL